ncbi:MAG: transcriptional regulator [Alphaproteobacteria bacterium]|nr:transcriptional regulator [Alphaproteobacteria bacterium]
MTKGYNQMCPVARTLDVIGEKWTILILRDLLIDGPRKFQDFEKSMPGIAPTTLSARLKTLQASDIIESRLYSNHPPRAEYSLTQKGKSLGKIVGAMRDWGVRHAGAG